MVISKFHSSWYLLALICALFLSSRLYKIAEIPTSVYWDEASIGYNAYSILKTGKDEWGEFLPLHFRAFGEFKLPVYIYATVATIKLFGLNEFSVRIPSFFFSLGVVILTFLLGKKLSGSSDIGLWGSFFITISPWFFIFSRTGYEATAGLMFYLLGIYLFLRLKENGWFILVSTLSFILSTYSYNSFRIITPLTLIILIFLYYDTLVYHNKILVSRRAILLSVILVLLSLLPIIRLVKFDSGIARLQTVGILSSGTKKDILLKFSQNYLSQFNPKFLFLDGDKNLRSQQANFGQLYLPDLILLPLAVIYILGRKSKYNLLIILLILLGPVPAAITKESPHALRTISLTPFLSILSALGILQLTIYSKKFIQIGMAVIFLLLFANYFISFINVYPTFSSRDWQYGYKRIYLDYKNEFAKYDQIIISDAYAQPYIFALFYLKINPAEFYESVVRWDISNWGFSTVRRFNNFEFGKANQLWEPAKKSTLIFASEKDKIPNLQPFSTINFLDGTVAFWVYQI